MKGQKVLLLLLILILSPKCFADDSNFIQQLRGHLEYNEEVEELDSNSIYLEPEAKKYINLTQPQSIKSKSLNLNNPDFSIFSSNMQKASTFSEQEYNIKSIYGDLSENYGKFTIGTKYGSYIDDGEINYMTGIYTKIDGKRLALTLAAQTQTGSSYSHYTDKIIIAPELKLTDRLSLLDIIKTDMLQTSQNNRIVLRYNPKLKNHNDDLFLEFGAENTYREQEYVKSSIIFSTRFNF